MKRLLAGSLVVPVVFGALLLSRSTPAGSPGSSGGKPDFQIKEEALNPWNNLKLNNDPKTFRFAIVSDRTGGARAGVFEKAVDQLNLLQPEFVVSIGDLIETDKDQKGIDKRWKEFNGFIAKLEMPFFYMPGNHDIANILMEKRWKDHFGRLWYHFKYKDVLFLLLNCEEQPGKDKESPGKIGAEQIAQAKKVLEDNRDVRYTLVFVHRPLWHSKDIVKNGWKPIEDALQGRRFTVFAGHEHRYIREVRNGSRYYTFATTGGVSKLRGVNFGEFDHLVWVTMKNDGPVLANLMMEGIFPEDVRVKK